MALTNITNASVALETLKKWYGGTESNWSLQHLGRTVAYNAQSPIFHQNLDQETTLRRTSSFLSFSFLPPLFHDLEKDAILIERRPFRIFHKEFPSSYCFPSLARNVLPRQIARASIHSTIPWSETMAPYPSFKRRIEHFRKVSHLVFWHELSESANHWHAFCVGRIWVTVKNYKRRWRFGGGESKKTAAKNTNGDKVSWGRWFRRLLDAWKFVEDIWLGSIQYELTHYCQCFFLKKIITSDMFIYLFLKSNSICIHTYLPYTTHIKSPLESDLISIS